MIDGTDLSPAQMQAIAEAIARQNAIDYEDSGPKAPHGKLIYRGVLIDSRWDVLSEYHSLRAIVDQLPDLMRLRIESIWCDSKCTNNYIITVKSQHFVEVLPDAIEAAVIAVRRGHNGIMLQGHAGPHDYINIDCNWDSGADADDLSHA